MFVANIVAVWVALHLPVLAWTLYPGKGTGRLTAIWSTGLIAIIPVLLTIQWFSCTHLECLGEPFYWVGFFIAGFVVAESAFLLALYLIGRIGRYFIKRSPGESI